MKSSSAILAALLLTTLPIHEGNAAGATLLVDGTELQPSSTLEIRFETDMVKRDLLGVPLPGSQSPLQIEPPISGTFTWLSKRSGVYVPSGAPRLGEHYQLSLKQGLKDQGGKPITTRINKTLSTPPFGLTYVSPKGPGADFVSPLLESKLTFNMPIQAGLRIRYVADDVTTREAVVRYATEGEYFPRAARTATWLDQWQQTEPNNPLPLKEIKNRLIVKPQLPLTPGPVWYMELPKGVTSLDGEYQTSKAIRIELGRARPFEVESVTATSELNTGRHLEVKFTASLAPDVNNATAANFVQITPKVKNLQYEERWNSLVLTGDFVRGQEYSLEVDPSLLSRETLPITGDLKHTFHFEPITPRLYLPAFVGNQYSAGKRVFYVLSANLQSLRVKALRVSAGDVPQAIKTYKKDYEYHYDPDTDQPHQQLPDEAIKGELIYDQTRELEDLTVDVAQRTALNWNEILGDRPAGVVLLTIEGTPIDGTGNQIAGAQALIQLTDLAAMWKHTAGNIWAQAFSQQTGQPLSDVEIEILSDKFELSSRAKTNSSGVAELSPGKDPAWMILSKRGDLQAVRIGPWAQALPMYAFGLPIQYSSWTQPKAPREQLRGLLFTDRPLYLPGETAHVKGILRRIRNGKLAPAAKEKWKLVMNLPNGRGRSEYKVETDERGSFNIDLQLDPVAVGRYSLDLRSNLGGSLYTGFVAAEFEPEAFDVQLQLPERFSPEDSPSASITAKYYFGGPIRKGVAKWILELQEMPFSPSGYPDFQFTPSANNREIAPYTTQGESDLSEVLELSPRVPKVGNTPQMGSLTVQVTDINQQTVTARRTFTRESSDFYLGISWGKQQVVAAGQEIPIQVIAVSPDELPLREPQKLSLTLTRLNHRTLRILGAGGAIEFKNELTREEVAKSSGSTLQPVQENGKWVVKGGQSSSFKLPAAGEYEITATATDANGRETSSTRRLYVSGQAATWDVRHPAQIDLIPDRESYQVGDKARILVKTPIEGRALISVEQGDRVLRQFEEQLGGSAPTVEIPILSGDGPNVFVSAVLIRGADESPRKNPEPDYRYGACMLKIDNPALGITVEVIPERVEFQPEQNVKADVLVNDATGSPISNAEVTFYAIDEGVVSLTGFKRPRPASIFNKPLPLSVETGLTIQGLLPENLADLDFSNKGYLIGGGLAMSTSPLAKVRTRLPGTAVWLPSLKTDSEGRAVASFTAPNALTQYRLVAVVNADTDRFGAAESRVRIKKPLMLLAAPLPVAHEGDTLVARAVINNETGKSGKAVISLTTGGLSKPADGTLTKELDINIGESQEVDFPITFTSAGTANWTWQVKLQANGQVYEDALSTSVRVSSPAPLLREIYLTDLKHQENDLLKGVNPQVLEGTGTISTTLSNTRLASLREAANSLLTYPYGCAEQLVSALIPWLAVSELAPLLPEVDKSHQEREKTIKASMSKISALQTDSGGIGYWPGRSKPDLFASGWAALAFAMANEQGIQPPAGYRQLLDYLSGQLRGIGSEQTIQKPEALTLALYALARAGRSEPGYIEVLLGRKTQLSQEARALLALSMVWSGSGNDEEIKWLLDSRHPAPAFYSPFGSPTRQLAVQLLAWATSDPQDKETGRLVIELLQARTNGSWRTTQENAWALLALGNYFRRVEGKIQPVQAQLQVAGGKKELEVSVPVDLTEAKNSFQFDAAYSETKPLKSLVAVNPQERNLYGETRFVTRSRVTRQPRQDRGYAIYRKYQKIAGDGSLQPTDHLQVGDRVIVTLEVSSPKPGFFVAIDDPLPAILEPLNPDFKSSRNQPGQQLATIWSADYRETRADRVVFFCDFLPAGTHKFQYLTQVRLAGDSIAPGTKAEEMYRPERFGLGETSRLMSKALR